MKWTKEEEAFLKETYAHSAESEIVSKLTHRNWSGIRSRAQKLKLIRDTNLTVLKRKSTCLAKYGVDNAAKLQESKDKSRVTCLEKYGTVSPLKNSDIMAKRDQTCLALYGVKNVSQDETIKAAQVATCLKRHNVANPMQKNEFKSKRFNKEFSDVTITPQAES